MKRKLFKVVLLVVVVSAAIGWNFSQNKKGTGLSVLGLANVEALARYEDPNEGKGMKKETCYNSNGVAIGARCVSSASHSDYCHYQNDTWGKCN